MPPIWGTRTSGFGRRALRLRQRLQVPNIEASGSKSISIYIVFGLKTSLFVVFGPRNLLFVVFGLRNLTWYLSPETRRLPSILRGLRPQRWKPQSRCGARSEGSEKEHRCRNRGDPKNQGPQSRPKNSSALTLRSFQKNRGPNLDSKIVAPLS